MCELFALSSKINTVLSASLGEFSSRGGLTDHHTDGWGMATYHGKIAQVHKESQPAAFSPKLADLQSSHQPTQMAISHIRRATIGEISMPNTQPFTLEIAGHCHIFAHNGHLPDIEQKFELTDVIPEGSTDSEYAFCYLMSAVKTLWRDNVPSLQERMDLIETIFTELATLGPANFLYSDGDYLYAFANKRIQPSGKIEHPGMHYLTRTCYENHRQPDSSPEKVRQKVVLFASVPLTDENWQPLPCCKLVVAQNGHLEDIPEP